MVLGDGNTVKIVDNSTRFTDLPDTYWGADAITFVSSRALMNGTGTATFSPSRAEVATIFMRWNETIVQ